MTSPMLLTVSLVMIGASLGALLRFGTFQAISPLWALLLVNALGSFVVGAVAQRLSQGTFSQPYFWQTLLIVGFCGSLTTFSSYALEMVYLIERGYFFKMACHFFLNNALCLLLCYIGYSKFSWIL